MSFPYCLVDNKYEIEKKIGSGSFGVIYLGKNLYNKEKVALKFEPINNKSKQLHFEYKVYRSLQNGEGIPLVFDYYNEYDTPWGKYNILVMELLQSSLDDLFEKCNGFTLKTVIQIAIQLIKRINYLHDKNLIHRDIKPDNFLIDKNNTIYLIDFGLSKLYRDTKTHTHIRYREDKKMVGTPRYVSINTHLGIEQSRRDDLEAIGYVLIYFLKKKLPWQGIKCDDRKLKYKKIMEKKLSVSIQELCYNLPIEFEKYFEYVRYLRFGDKPDYEHLINLFKKIAKNNNIIINNNYDWNNNILEILNEKEEGSTKDN